MKSNQDAMLSFFVNGQWGDEYEFTGLYGRGATYTDVREAMHECDWGVTESAERLVHSSPPAWRAVTCVGFLPRALTGCAARLVADIQSGGRPGDDPPHTAHRSRRSCVHAGVYYRLLPELLLGASDEREDPCLPPAACRTTPARRHASHPTRLGTVWPYPTTTPEVGCSALLSPPVGRAQIWKGYIECTNMCGKTFLEDENGPSGQKEHRPDRRDAILSTDPYLPLWSPWWVGYEFEDKIGEPVYSIDWEISAGLPQAQRYSVCLSVPFTPPPVNESYLPPTIVSYLHHKPNLRKGIRTLT